MSWRVESVEAPEPCYRYVVSDSSTRLHTFLFRRRWYESSSRFQRRVKRRIDWSLSR